MSWHGPRNRFRDNHENWNNEQERGYAGNGRGYNDRYSNNNEEDFGEDPQRWRNEGRRGYRGGRGRNRGQRGEIMYRNILVFYGMCEYGEFM